MMYFGLGRWKARTQNTLAQPTVGLLDQLGETKRNSLSCDDCEVVLDLAPVEKINSKDLGELVKFHLALSSQNRRLVLANATSSVAEVLEITRLYRQIEVRTTPLVAVP